MDLLERDTELGTLDRLLADAAEGSGQLVLVSGEPGIGKSSLAAAWCARIADRARVLAGACDDLLTKRTLGPFRDLVRGTDGPLARALESGGSRDEVFDAALTEFSNPLRPTVIVVEDLHWADEATLDVVRFLARRIGDEPTVLLATYRDDLPGDHPLHAALGALVGPAVTRISLHGLSTEAIAQLAGARSTPLEPEQLHEVTGGNPFFVTEVLAAHSAEVPTTVREAVAARIRDLPEPTRAALEELSASPGGLELHLVDHVVTGGAAALAEAERQSLLTVVGARVRFRHELVRRAVSAATPIAALAGAHARLLRALDPLRTDPSRLVHHAMGAGDAHAVVTHAPAAARAAVAAGAHRDAVDAFQQALRYPELLEPRDRAELRTDLARELLLVNRLEAGLVEAEAAVAEWERLDDAEGLGTALTVLADARYWGLRSDEAAATAERAVETLAPLPPARPLACAQSTLAHTYVMANRFEQAIDAAERAIATSQDIGTRDVLAHALTQRGTARSMQGDHGGLEDLKEALELGLSIPHHEHVVLASIGMASASFRTGRLAEAEDAMAVGMAYAEEHDLDTGAATLGMMRAGLDLARGDWRAAQDQLELTVGDGSGTGWGETVAAALLGRLLVRRGGGDEARQLLARAWSIAERSGEIQRIGPVAAAWAEWGWLTGRIDEVQDRVHDAVLLARDVGHAWYLGELQRYLTLAGEASPEAEASLTADPWSTGLTGDWRAAADAWAQLGWPYERALELASSREAEPMIEALHVVDGLGAVATATIVRRRLRELGVQRIPRGPREETRTNPVGLTSRQMEVLRLVTEGATNAQIAERLVVSPRTVDHHVSAVLSKLGVTSRREVAARAVELGLELSQPPAPAI